jgi:IMP cyclohydrolase
MSTIIEITEDEYFDIISNVKIVPNGNYIAICNPGWIYYSCVKVRDKKIVTNSWRVLKLAHEWLKKE